VIGIEMFNKLLDNAEVGDNVGILLRAVKSTEVTRGDCVVKPNSIKPGTKFEGTAYILNEEEGGRKKPFSAKYQYVSCFELFRCVNDDLRNSVSNKIGWVLPFCELIELLFTFLSCKQTTILPPNCRHHRQDRISTRSNNGNAW
jgi:hypothetical protein